MVEMNLLAALAAWRGVLGASQVLSAPAAQVAYGADASGNQRAIAGALRVMDAALLPGVMRIAQRYKVAVYPISTGRNWGYGTALPARDACVIVDLSGLQKILHFDDVFGVVTLEPGVTQAMLADFLAAGRHPFLVPVTGAGPHCSLVGNALERGYGVTPHADHFGAVTDIEAVLADGGIYRSALREAGGEDLARLFKWGIGPYTAGLFAQSGFGIVTRMTIALARRPESVKACLFSLSDDALLEAAVARVQRIVSRLPGVVGGINLMNQRRVLAMAAPYPADRVGADGLLPQPVIAQLGRQFQIFPWTGFGTLYGTRPMVAAAQREIRAALAGVASRLVFLSPAQAARLARLAGAIPGAIGRRLARTAAMIATSLALVDGHPNETALPLVYWRNRRAPRQAWRDPSHDGCGLIWFAPLVPMRPAGVRAYVEMVGAVTRAHRIEPLITLTSISDKLFDSTVPLMFERSDAAQVAAATACHDDLLERGRRLGVFPYRVGIHAMASLSRLSGEAGAFQARLRRDLDPDSLIAPGRYQ